MQNKSYKPYHKTTWLDIFFGFIGAMLGIMFAIVAGVCTLAIGLFIRFLGLIIAVVVVVLTLQFMGVL